MISTKGTPNSEALSAQRHHAPMGLRIRRLYLANRDIHQGCSEFGGFIGPKASCADGAPNLKIIWPIVISTKGALNPEALTAQRHHVPMGL
ncbi:hypothetical protein ACSBR2_021548 [Camellia fascicularis]